MAVVERTSLPFLETRFLVAVALKSNLKHRVCMIDVGRIWWWFGIVPAKYEF